VHNRILSRRRRATAALITCSVLSSLASAADTTWVGPAAGNWDTAANWNNGTPTLNNFAFIDNAAAGNAVVTIGTGLSRNVGTLNISAGDAVAVSNNSFLQLSGDGTNAAFINAGTLQVNSTASSTLFRLTATGVGTISGGGTIVLSGANAGLSGVAASRFINIDNFIRGQGNIGAELITFDNRGTIAADVSGGTLTLDPDGNSGVNSLFINTGTLVASDGGTLLLTGASGGSFTNTGGQIMAGNNSQVRYVSGAIVTGGILSSSGTGANRVAASASATFVNVTNNGLMVAENNSDLGITSSLINNGTVSVESTVNATDIEIQNDTIISGNGVIVLSGALPGINGAAASRLTLGAGQTVRGQGRIGQEVITITNNGLILADANAGTMTIDPDGNSGTNSFMLNNNLMRATNGATLLLTGSGGGTFSNVNGTITADDNSVVLLQTNASVTGGTFNTNGSGSVRVGVSQDAFFTNITNNGLMVAENNSDFGVGTSLVNNGTIAIEAGANATDLEIQNDTTISGTGVIILSGGNAGINGAAASRLTLGAGQTVRGQGRIGQELITITNNGLILADANAGTMTIDPDGNSGTNSFMLNNNLMRATNGATLLLTGSGGGTFSNVNGTITADDNSVVLLQTNASVTGGTFNTNGSGSVRVGAGQDAFFTNITSNGLMVGENNSDFGIATSFVNNGTIAVEAGANATDLEIQNDTTISGTGVIILSGGNAGINGAAGSRLTLGSGQTLRGQGAVMQEVITMTNNGVVSADVPGAVMTLDPDGNSGSNSFMLNNGTLRATNGGTLRLTGSSGGTFTGNGPVIADTGSTVETLTSAIATIGPVSGAGTVSIAGASNVQARHYRVGTLSVSSATARVAAGGGTLGTSIVNALSLAGTARLDLSDHDLAIDYSGSSVLNSIRASIATGFAGGAWNGVGINSSAAAASTSPKTALGYAEASQILSPGGGVFSGVAVDGTTVLVKYTVAGDANLSGNVNLDDFTALAANFGNAGVWTTGDFNYNGLVNLDDFTILAASFGQTLPADVARGAAVPEPAGAIGALVAAVVGLSRRRRSR